MLDDHRYDLVAPPDAALGVLVLHPHPDMGGDRHNPVVDAVFRASVGRGWAAVRFDFSSSDLEVAAAEASDALALLPADLPVGVVGYSFGAAVGAALDDDRAKAWALIAAPFGSRFPADGLAAGVDERPTLILSPAHDQFCPPDAASAATAGWTNATVEPVASADHFLAGSLDVVATRALDWVADAV